MTTNQQKESRIRYNFRVEDKFEEFVYTDTKKEKQNKKL